MEGAARAAGLLLGAWEAGTRIAALPPDARPRDLAEGYLVQRALAGLAGERIGWKIAASSRAGQAHIDVDRPLAGRLFRRFAHEPGARLDVSQMSMLVAEAELCFRLGASLPPRRAPYTRADVLAATEALHLAIEIPDSRYEDFLAVGAPSLVADDACASLFVLGPVVDGGWRELDLSQQPSRFLRDGALAAEGSGGNVLGDPRDALVWIANELVERGEQLEAGDVVTTGTTTVPLPIAPGQELVAEFPGLGSVAVSLQP